MKRQAFITPLQHFWLLVADHEHQAFSTSQGLTPKAITPLVYSSLIQSGVDQIAFSSGAQLPTDLPSHVKNRIVRRNIDAYFDVAQFSSQLLKNAALEQDPSKQPGSLTYLWAFLSDVLHALRQRSPIVTFSGIPDISELMPHLNPEVALPIANLISSIEVANFDVATPTSAISVKKLALLEEVLSDAAFSSYVSKQEQLERSELSIAQVEQLIGIESRSVVARHNRILRVERFGASTLAVTAKFIDTILGGIPGKIGAELARSGETFLRERQRIVIYRYPELLGKIYAANLQAQTSQVRPRIK